MCSYMVAQTFKQKQNCQYCTVDSSQESSITPNSQACTVASGCPHFDYFFEILKMVSLSGFYFFSRTNSHIMSSKDYKQ